MAFESIALMTDRVVVLLTSQDIDAMRVLKLVPSTVVIYLTLLEAHYSSSNPYHNSIHAADVAQSANVLLRRPALQVGQIYRDVF